ncbi:MAG: hypothetical protein V1754_05480 [Pseudomonadota bacterium]
MKLRHTKLAFFVLGFAACGDCSARIPVWDDAAVDVADFIEDVAIDSAEDSFYDSFPTWDFGAGPSECAEAIGKPCTRDAHCGPEAKCLQISPPEPGVCSCKCTPDNPQTNNANEDSCPNIGQNICGEWPSSESGAVEYFCFMRCTPELGKNDCIAPIACDPTSTRFGAYGVAVCVILGCQADVDCPVTNHTKCDLEFADDCPPNEKCVPVREESQVGHCGQPGKCDLQSGLCAPHDKGTTLAKVGDSCVGDIDCGNKMHCVAEGIENGVVESRNGYCTISGCMFAGTLTDAACPEGSYCNKIFVGGVCQKSCSLEIPETCRGVNGDFFGDYECRAYNNFTTDLGLLADGPVCDWGSTVPCDLVPELTCNFFGLKAGNTTKMTCRGLDGEIKSDPQDSTGFCLDNTTSGPFVP